MNDVTIGGEDASNLNREERCAEIYEALAPRIFNLCLRLISRSSPTFSPYDAEDLMQETFEKIFVNLASFQGRSALFTWAYRICLNVWAAGKRKERAFERRIEELAHFERLYSPDDPEELLLKKLGEEKVLSLLDCLNESERAAFVLNVLEKLDTAEVSRILGRSEGAIRTAVCRARFRLAKALVEVR
jgi:RNA polymerase sigma-70 factor, ECF subfamily